MSNIPVGHTVNAATSVTLLQLFLQKPMKYWRCDKLTGRKLPLSGIFPVLLTTSLQLLLSKEIQIKGLEVIIFSMLSASNILLQFLNLFVNLKVATHD